MDIIDLIIMITSFVSVVFYSLVVWALFRIEIAIKNIKIVNEIVPIKEAIGRQAYIERDPYNQAYEGDIPDSTRISTMEKP